MIYGCQLLTPLNSSFSFLKSGALCYHQDLFPRCHVHPLGTHIQYIHAVHFQRGRRWTVPCSSRRFNSFPEDTVMVQHINFLRGLTLWPLGDGAVSLVLWKMYNPQPCQQTELSVKYVLWIRKVWNKSESLLFFALCSNNLFCGCLLSIFAQSHFKTVKLLHVKGSFLLLKYF